MTTQDIDEAFFSGNWYYAQGLGSSSGYMSCHRVIFAPDKATATEEGKRWQAEKGFRELHLYRNNYKREARGMIASGNYR